MCTKVIRSFDPRGTKDGNVLGRLQAFARSMLNHPGGMVRPVAVAAAPGMEPWAAPHVQQLARQRQSLAAPSGAPSAAEYAFSIGLDQAGVSFLEGLPEDVRAVVVAAFNPRGTKDGNVFGRLLGFARAIWAQRLGLDRGQLQEVNGILRSLPEEVQARIITQFVVAGTKDGNVLARFQRFASDVASRCSVPALRSHAPAGNSAAAPVALVAVTPVQALTPAPFQVAAHSSVPQSKPQLASVIGGAPLRQPPGAAVLPRGLATSFAVQLGLDATAVSFLRSLPEDVQTAVVTSFDPRGTKDGNVWGRLFGFVRSVWAQRLGLEASTITLLKSLPEEVQRTVMVKFDPSRTKDGNLTARLESFALSVASHPSRLALVGPAAVALAPPTRRPPVAVARVPQLVAAPSPLQDFARRWELNAEAVRFLGALPESVLGVVISSFHASGTKDGNVWGRLFGFVRSVWAQRVGLDTAALAHMKTLPEDVQQAVMMRFELGLGDGAEGPVRCQAVVAEALLMQQQQQQPGQGQGPELDDVASFVLLCGLDTSAADFLYGLSPEVRAAVISDFDPGGTKDGNLFGRLQGFARSVEARRKRSLGGLPQDLRNVKSHWQDAMQ